MRTDWELLAGEFPYCSIETEDLPLFGNRNIDLAYDWTPYIGRYEEFLLFVRNYWKDMRTDIRLDNVNPVLVSVEVEKLNVN